MPTPIELNSSPLGHKHIPDLLAPLYYFPKRYRPCLFTVKGGKDFTIDSVEKIKFSGEWDKEKGEWADWWLKECEAAEEEE